MRGSPVTAQAVVRGAARCASQVLDRGAQVDARGTAEVLYGDAQEILRGAAGCALQVGLGSFQLQDLALEVS